MVLYEDEVHDSFVRRLVEHLGLRPTRFERCVDSTGVLSRVAAEVGALRSQKHQANLGLVVVIDADKDGFEGRLREIEKRVAVAVGGPRTDDERIAYVIPAREIETWYVHFCCPEARPVDENRDYKEGSTEWRELRKNLGATTQRAIKGWSQRVPAEPIALAAARKDLERLTP